MKFVIGMHRSGTSLVANLLRDLGVDFGDDKDFLPPQPDNPEGFLENKAVVALHDELLRELGGDWFNPAASAVLTEAQACRINKLRAQLEQKGIVGVKDPRMSLFLPYWINDSDELLVCVRDPLAVASSLGRRNHLPAPLGCALWLIYNHSVFSAVQAKNARVVDYSDLLEHSTEASKKLAAFSGASMQVALKAIDGRVTQKRSKGDDQSPDDSLDVFGARIYSLADNFYSAVKRGDLSGALSLYDPKVVISYVSAFSGIIRRSEELREKSQKLHSLQQQLEILTEIRDQETAKHESLARAHDAELDEHKKLHVQYKNLLAKYEEGQEKSEYHFREWSHAKSQINDLNEALAEFEAREDRYLRDLYEFKQSVVPRLHYFIFRVYKFITFRKAHKTFFDKLFLDNHVPVKYRRQGKVRSLYNVVKFILQNPSIAVHNLSIRNANLLLRKFTGSKADLAQWLNARMPLQGDAKKLTIEKFESDEHIRFPKQKEIHVSIIVPVYNNIEITLSLLKSIEKHTTVPYEVIIADDCSTDETQYISRFVDNVVHVRNDVNKGFLLNCNNAAHRAQGEIVLLLNNDTNVTEGWLEPLVESFEDRSVGVVGPKILFVDGRLQEAGGIIWQDASGWNYGRMGDPADPEYNYLKEVDYVSGCCLAIRKALWQEIGGFDERYVPAYYEDTDLCFEARAKGYKVIYQPASTIVHLEGASHGTDTNSGIKRYQQVNKQIFLEKWRSVLQAHNENACNVFQSRDRSQGKKCILFVDHYVPHFDKDAGSRAVHMYLKILVEMGFNVKFVGDNFYKHEPYTSELQAMGIEVLYGNYHAANIYDWIRENKDFIDVAFLNRPHVSERYIDLLASLGIRCVYFGHDLHFLRLKRQAELESDLRLAREAESWKVREISIIQKSDVVYYPSTTEVDILRSECSVNNAYTLPLFSYPVEREIDLYKSNDRQGLLFVGGFGHPPNVDAVEWFYSEIFPLMDSSALPVYIVGSSVPEHIMQLSGDNFRVLGYQSDEELKKLYARVKLGIVPLRYGAGVKGKVLEAMYHSVPVVGTSVALEGVGDLQGVAFECNSANEFAGVINELVKDQERLAEVSKAAKHFINLKYNSQVIKEIFSRDFFEAVSVDATV